MCFRYYQTINIGGALVEWHTCGGPVAHGCLLVNVLDTFIYILAQHSACSGLAVSITVVPLVHTVYEQPLPFTILIIV